MSSPGRPKGEFRNAKHEGNPVSPPGCPKGSYAMMRSMEVAE